MVAVGPAMALSGVLAMAVATVPVMRGHASACDGSGEQVRPDRTTAAGRQISCGEAARVEGRFDFDIQPQALDGAIEAFSTTTGQSVIYDSRLTSGIASTGVDGRYMPAEAMARILEGSGLAVRRVGSDALVLVRDSPATEAGQTGAIVDERWYYGAIQKKVNDAFCRRAELAGGGHRIALQIWLAADGRLDRMKLLESTGEPRVDAAVYDATREIELARAVPDSLAQPFTMLILPRGSGYEWGCPQPETERSQP
ncbi:secretin and TonB N-terminal domain-containing protein [Luteimonas sp. R10]|uniref:secretin and TonB N-terminal domain-containing protein n=1 Tax=Luteimonas sp. R10 TaxID=3108176 RepID=UPI00308BFB9F|nr:secretin and TonB N-terminal domain-containing protein [Luteimonas sp. R10]